MRVGASKPAQDDHDNLPTHEMTSSRPFHPGTGSLSKPRRLSDKKVRTARRKLRKLSESSGMSAKEWKRRLAGETIDVIAKTLGRTTQLSMCTECESESATRKHVTSRFPVLKNH